MKRTDLEALERVAKALGMLAAPYASILIIGQSTS
jgi:hypothetical protein